PSWAIPRQSPSSATGLRPPPRATVRRIRQGQPAERSPSADAEPWPSPAASAAAFAPAVLLRPRRLPSPAQATMDAGHHGARWRYRLHVLCVSDRKQNASPPIVRNAPHLTTKFASLVTNGFVYPF